MMIEVHDFGWALMMMARNPGKQFHNGNKIPTWFDAEYGVFYYISPFTNGEKQVEEWESDDMESKRWEIL